MKTVLVFGVFDHLHEGHLAMLREARTHGDRLVVCLAHSDVVLDLKGKAPAQTFDERAEALRQTGLVDDIHPGDNERGTYSALERVKPSMIVLGYDQVELGRDLERFVNHHKLPITLTTARPYKPDTYKTSLLNPS